MKSVVTLLILVFSSYALADGTCPNLNGTFRVNDITAVRMTQQECQSIKAAYGEIQEFGKIDWYKASVVTNLDGAIKCDSFGCMKGTVKEGKIELSRDSSWSLYTAQHGTCEYSDVRYSINAQGNLVSEINAHNCQDQFTGIVESIFVRLN